MTKRVRTILIVDDEEVLRDVTERLFRKLGYEAVSVADPESAIQLVRNAPDIAVAFIDGKLPGSGCGLAARIKAVRPDIDTVLTTGDPFYCQERRARGSTRCPTCTLQIVPKPYTLVELRDAITLLREDATQTFIELPRPACAAD